VAKVELAIGDEARGERQWTQQLRELPVDAAVRGSGGGHYPIDTLPYLVEPIGAPAPAALQQRPELGRWRV
jgi:hypothetical protein